jgi:hypothetical protein
MADQRGTAEPDGGPRRCEIVCVARGACVEYRFLSSVRFRAMISSDPSRVRPCRHIYLVSRLPHRAAAQPGTRFLVLSRSCGSSAFPCRGRPGARGLVTCAPHRESPSWGHGRGSQGGGFELRLPRLPTFLLSSPFFLGFSDTDSATRYNHVVLYSAHDDDRTSHTVCRDPIRIRYFDFYARALS